MRHLLPAVVAIVITAAFLRWTGARQGLYGRFPQIAIDGKPEHVGSPFANQLTTLPVKLNA